jgi:hypothetical protein
MIKSYKNKKKPPGFISKEIASSPKQHSILPVWMMGIKSLSAFLLVLSFWMVGLSANAQAPTWSVQSDYFGERDAIAQPRTTRGMALSQDGLSVYTGLIQSPNTGSTSLRKVSSAVLAVPGTDHVIFGNGMPGGTGTFGQVGGQPVYAGGTTNTFQGWRDVPNSPEGIATDDRGYVYVALTSGVTNANRVEIYNSDLSGLPVGVISIVGNPRGVRIHKIGTTYYAYTTSDLGLQRYDVTNVAGPTLDASYTPGIFGGKNLTIDLDGTVYVAGNNQVRRISPTGTLTHTSGAITDAKDVSVYYNTLYVIKDGSPSKTITVLNKADLTSAGADLTVPDFGITRSTISQFKSVDVNSKGNLYISEENYNGTQFLSGGYLSSYTPPVTTFNPTPGAITGRIYFDRVVTSSFVEPDYANIQVTVTDNSAEISYNDWFSVYSLDGVNYSTPASNPFTLTDLAPGEYTVYIKDGLGNISTETFTIEAPKLVTLTVDAPSTANCGDEVTVYVRSTGFVADVSTLQFSVNWDPTQLGYVSSSFDPAVYLAGGDDPLITHPATSLTGPDGAVTYVWGDGNPPFNLAIPDNSDLMSLTFTVLLAGNLEINLSGTPTEIGATDSDFEDIDVVTINDEITVENSCIQLITVTADDLSKFCGQLDPAFTFQITEGELAEGDVFTGSLEREPGETAGTYAITQGTLSLEGYSITFIPGVFEINGITVDASASSTPVPVGSPATLKATVSPATAGITVVFTLDDGNGGVKTYSGVTDANGLASATVPASDLKLEVFMITAVAGSGCASSVAYLPVYDPSASFVTGGGWINSPAGAMPASPEAVGKANFGFVSKYKKGKNGFTNEVDGNTEFQFQAGDLNFKSTMNESGSLVISGAKATYRGSGTVNGQAGFKFMVVGIDGNWNGGTGSDRFRIKISNSATGTTVYDNQIGLADNSDVATVIGGGSIVIHEVKAKGNKRIEPGSMEDEMNSTLEIKEKEFGPNKILVYPNPASEASNIQVSLNQDSDVSIRIFDSAGRLMMEEHSYHETSFVKELDLKGLSNGVYHIVVQINHQVMTKRLVKK